MWGPVSRQERRKPPAKKISIFLKMAQKIPIEKMGTEIIGMRNMEYCCILLGTDFRKGGVANLEISRFFQKFAGLTHGNQLKFHQLFYEISQINIGTVRVHVMLLSG